MNYAYQQTTASSVPILTTANAKLQLRIDNTTDDTAIDRRVASATFQAEQYLMRGLTTQTWKYAQDDWTDIIALPMAAPLASVSSVKYYDASGVQQTLATTVYGVDTLSEPGRVYLKPNQVWPALQSDQPLPIEIIYVVGYTTAALVPADIIDAICLLLGDRQEFRTDTMAGSHSTMANGAAALLAPHRRFWCPPVAS